MLADASLNISSGKISAGVELDSSIKAVVDFIEIHFPVFSKKHSGEISMNEKGLTDILCKFLNRNAGLYPFFFHHENIEDPSSGKSPQVDVGTLSRSYELVIGDRTYGENDSFFSMEAKRLPTPGQNREKEYVIGHDKPCGGIERFKKSIHGKKLKYAAIIGYVQKEDSNHWFLKINDWIGEMIAAFPKEWNEDDKIVPNDNTTPQISKFVSKSSRTETNDHINLFHFWINLIENKK